MVFHGAGKVEGVENRLEYEVMSICISGLRGFGDVLGVSI